MKAVSVAMIAKSEKMKLKKSRSRPKNSISCPFRPLADFFKNQSRSSLKQFFGNFIPPSSEKGWLLYFCNLLKQKSVAIFYENLPSGLPTIMNCFENILLEENQWILTELTDKDKILCRDSVRESNTHKQGN